MVLPQLDAYHSGRQLQHLQPWVSVELAQQQSRGQPGVRLTSMSSSCTQMELRSCCLVTRRPSPQFSPWDLCAARNLGSMESNVMAGRALFGCLQLPESVPIQQPPISLARLLDQRTLSQINVGNSLIAAVLADLLIATAPEEFGVPECTNALEAAGLEGSHRWGIILPNSSRVSLLTYKAIVAVRYPELVLHDQNPIQIGHFVSRDHTVEHGGFRTVL